MLSSYGGIVTREEWLKAALSKAPKLSKEKLARIRELLPPVQEVK